MVIADGYQCVSPQIHIEESISHSHSVMVYRQSCEFHRDTCDAKHKRATTTAELVPRTRSWPLTGLANVVCFPSSANADDNGKLISVLPYALLSLSSSIYPGNLDIFAFHFALDYTPVSFLVCFNSASDELYSHCILMQLGTVSD